MYVHRPTTQILASAPLSYFVFDVLAVDGQSTIGLPYLERRLVRFRTRLRLHGHAVIAAMEEWIEQNG
ncbi:hypothetical protein A6F55_24210 [Prescottella equi]|nr:hypothetical protein A6F55_24210 [Prescottella equi]